MTELGYITWCQFTRSDADGNCGEADAGYASSGVRDSKDRNDSTLHFTGRAWYDFIACPRETSTSAVAPYPCSPRTVRPNAHHDANETVQAHQRRCDAEAPGDKGEPHTERQADRCSCTVDVCAPSGTTHVPLRDGRRRQHRPREALP
ncbi:DUF397 domain-containing protein [Actinoplanes sp. NPDC049599]|uniref:DUF397 domain-containing protein n=1 Tax=Actinoplanes sp. NPDC049599 TaxID=3363903 RepID=UPI003799AA2C